MPQDQTNTLITPLNDDNNLGNKTHESTRAKFWSLIGAGAGGSLLIFSITGSLRREANSREFMAQALLAVNTSIPKADVPTMAVYDDNQRRSLVWMSFAALGLALIVGSAQKLIQAYGKPQELPPEQAGTPAAPTM